MCPVANYSSVNLDMQQTSEILGSGSFSFSDFLCSYTLSGTLSLLLVLESSIGIGKDCLCEELLEA